MIEYLWLYDTAIRWYKVCFSDCCFLFVFSLSVYLPPFPPPNILLFLHAEHTHSPHVLPLQPCSESWYASCAEVSYRLLRWGYGALLIGSHYLKLVHPSFPRSGVYQNWLCLQHWKMPPVCSCCFQPHYHLTTWGDHFRLSATHYCRYQSRSTASPCP